MWLHVRVTESRAALQLCFLPCGELHSAKLIILVFNTKPPPLVAKHWCRCCVPARRASDKTAACRTKNRTNRRRFADESERRSVWHLRRFSHLELLLRVHLTMCHYLECDIPLCLVGPTPSSSLPSTVTTTIIEWLFNLMLQAVERTNWLIWADEHASDRAQQHYLLQ